MREDRSMMWAGIAVLALAVVVAAFLLSRNNTTTVNNTTTPPTTNPSPTPNPSSDEVQSFDLNEQNDSGQNGTVTLQDMGNGKTKVKVQLSNSKSTPEPAHIHLGTCPVPGTVQFPLNNVVDGTSETTIDASIADLVALGALSVNVHKSAEESSVYVSCGNLSLL